MSVSTSKLPGHQLEQLASKVSEAKGYLQVIVYIHHVSHRDRTRHQLLSNSFALELMLTG